MKRARRSLDTDQSSHESPSRRDSMSMSHATRMKKRRGKLPDPAIKMLKVWLFEHSGHPYPSENEKALMINETNLSLIQINNWFSNARRRILRKDS